MTQVFTGSSVSADPAANQSIGREAAPQSICPPNHGDLLNAVAATIRRFVSLSEIQAVVIALWIAHTHALDAAETTPYLNVSSAEKQCGKTILLEVLNLLVVKPWFTGMVSRAVLVRRIDALQPTLLLDESDAAFASNKEYAEALRGVLNSGRSREGVCSLCVGQGTNITFKDFRVFCPKAIAGIGGLPGTVADRSIPIRMKRRAPNEAVERFRPRLHKADCARIREQLTNWLSADIEALRDARPELPELLSDRQQDGCEPLLAIADLAGGDWPERARAAVIGIFRGEGADDPSIGVRLLFDIRIVFGQQNQVERIFTIDLLAALCDLEPQWQEYSYGKPLSAASMARLLKAFGIMPRKIRIDNRTASGYFREWFSDAWARYLRCKPEQMEQCSNDAGYSSSSGLEQRATVLSRPDEKSSRNARVVPPVPPCSGSDGRERHCYVHSSHTQWWQHSDGSGEVCNKCHPSQALEDSRKYEPPSAQDIGFDTESFGAR